ncbi:MAG: AAA family ATPase [Desulfamplus sp.]
MKLESISLKNFRCYKEIEVKLHPVITVFVGNNGHGKTALLDAIRIALWSYVSNFDLARSAYADPANTISVSDVLMLKTDNAMMARQLPSEIEITGNYGDGLTTWKRFRDSEAPRSQTKDDVSTQAMKKYAEKLQALIRNVNDEPVDLPVLGYYGTGRLWKEKRLTQSKKESNLPIKIDPQIENPVVLVQKAVNVLLKDTGWQNLVYSEIHDKSLILEHPQNGILKVEQLSHGIRNMLAMIADIAYRCVLLNSHLGVEAALKSHGIVMIDEVDMHLHPHWQQTVIDGLIRAFPNIQFIVTTHSPQLLTTVKKESVRLLKEKLDSDSGRVVLVVEIPEIQPKGTASSDVLAWLMDIDPVPDVEESNWLRNEHEITP